MISYTKVLWKRHLVILRFSDLISFAANSKTNGKQSKIHSTMCLNSFLVTTSCISLLHRPLFIKFFFIPAEPLFPTTKQIISPATITREKIFSGVAVLRFGRFLFLRGYCTSGPYFWRLCVFSQKIKQLRTKYLMDLVRIIPRNSKITVLLQ